MYLTTHTHSLTHTPTGPPRNQGNVVEIGSPSELLADPNSAYSQMIKQQGASRQASDAPDEDLEDAAAASKRKSTAYNLEKSSRQASDADVVDTKDSTNDSTKESSDVSASAAKSWAWKIARQSPGWLVASILASFLAGFGWPIMTVLLAKIVKVCGGCYDGVDYM